MKRPPFDVVVIGAGAAGLAAVRDLSQAGLRLALLEARPRVGGRILTLRDEDTALPVELGAEFIHGDAEEVRELCSAGRLIVDRLSAPHYYARGGSLKPVADFWGTVEDYSRTLRKRFNGKGVRDRSFAEALEHSRLSPQRRDLLLQYARGFQCADPNQLSARSVAGEGAEASDQQYRVIDGYDSVLEELRAESDADCIDLRLGTIVTAIRWKAGEVDVRTRSEPGSAEESFEAKACVVALPHAVLKAGSVRLEPEVKEVTRALRHLEVGQVYKIVLRFREAFWEDEAFLSERVRPRPHPWVPFGFVQSPGEDVPVWWSADPARTPILTGWAGGPDAEALLRLDERSRVERSLQSLSRALATPRERLDALLERWWMHDWSQDPFSLGAYSYVGVGGMSALPVLSHPVRGTLFFAGDYMTPGTMGTVEGAIEGGRRAARQLMESRS